MKYHIPPLLATSLFALSPAHADFKENFQGYVDPENNGYWSFAFDGGGGQATLVNSGHADNTGPQGDGDTAYYVNADFSAEQGASTYWGAGFAATDVLLGAGTDISKIEVSVDLWTSESNPVQIIIRNGDFGQPALEGYFVNAAPNTWQRHTFRLSSLTPTDGAYNPAGLTNIIFQINADWGRDPNNVMRIDNIEVIRVAD